MYRATLLSGQNIDPSTKEVMRYRQALWHGIQELPNYSLSTNLFVKLAHTITRNEGGIRVTPGTKIANSLNEVIYTPPEGEEIIRSKLANLENFIHAEDGIDPLIKLGVIHYQFEAIHPFSDGNGRVGRIINILYLTQQGLLEKPVLFLSRYFIENREGYYMGLKNITEKNDWESWIFYILAAVEHTSYQTIKKIDEIAQLMQKFGGIIKKESPKIYSKDLVEVLFAQPYCRASSLVGVGLAERQTASEYLKKIEKLSLIKSFKVGREMIYFNAKLFEILRK